MLPSTGTTRLIAWYTTHLFPASVLLLVRLAVLPVRPLLGRPILTIMAVRALSMCLLPAHPPISSLPRLLLLLLLLQVILDEAHERSTNTDILVGLLSRALVLRNTLARTEADSARASAAAAGTPPRAPGPS